MLFALIVALWSSGDPTDEWGLALGWGENFYGQCNTPPNLRHKIKSVHVGERHTVALLYDGTLRAWGDNTFGQCQVPAGYFRDVSVGQFHSAAIRINGELALWGSNFSGETLYNGTDKFQSVFCPARNRRTEAVKEDGSLMTFGEESCLSSSDLPFVTRAASFIQINQIVRSFFVGENGENYLSTSFNTNLCEEFEPLPEGNLVLGCECGVVLGTEGQILWTSCNIPPYEGEIVEMLPGINGSVLQTSAGLYSNAPMGEIPAVSAVVSGDIGRFHAYVLPETDCNTNGIEDVMDLELGTSSDFNRDGVPDECERDCDQDGIPDFIQIEQSVFADCDQSGVLDLCEIALGLRFDADGNGVPDRCERDCNLNGVPDFLDIFSGSVDVDSDGIPDECSTDCNQNGLWDVPEIDQGFISDCDSDGVPDDCQVDTDGDTIIDPCDPDDDGDGILDECDIDTTDGSDCDRNGVDDICQKGQDLDGDGIADNCDAEVCGIVIGSDCQGDGILDSCQLESNDCNMNEVPDDCEADCDFDSIPDDCESDVNQDDVPDDCQCLPDVVPNQQVDFADLITITSNWGACPEVCAADLNADGSIGLYELIQVLSAWGPCPNNG